MYAQKRQNRRTQGRKVSDGYLTRKERKAIEWLEMKRREGKKDDAKV